jgi:hypothetical protein
MIYNNPVNFKTLIVTLMSKTLINVFGKSGLKEEEVGAIDIITRK